MRLCDAVVEGVGVSEPVRLCVAVRDAVIDGEYVCEGDSDREGERVDDGVGVIDPDCDAAMSAAR